MKKIILGIAFLLFFLGCSKKSDEVITPPTATTLEAYLLKNGYDKNNDGKIRKEDQLEGFTDLNLSGKGLTDLQGLEVFTQLETLNASGNNLTEVTLKNRNLTSFNLSNNKLVKLDISNLPLIGRLPMDVSGNPNLTCVSVGGNKLIIEQNMKKHKKDAQTQFKSTCN